VIVLQAVNEPPDAEREFMVRLYRDYYGLIYSQIARALPDDGQLDDVVNEVCVRLIHNIERLQALDERALPAYVAYTTRSVVIDHLRRAHFEMGFTTQEVWGDTPDAEMMALRRLRVEELRDVMRRLPEKYRDVLHMKYYLDMPNDEIAKNLGIKPGGVNVYLMRAKRKVLQMYREEGMLDDE